MAGALCGEPRSPALIPCAISFSRSASSPAPMFSASVMRCYLLTATSLGKGQQGKGIEELAPWSSAAGDYTAATSVREFLTT